MTRRNDLIEKLSDVMDLEGAKAFVDEVIAESRPRCDSCKHWNKLHGYKDPAGTCPVANVWSDCGDYTIITAADFGCVQWEAKAVLPTGCTCSADMVPGRADKEHHSVTCPKREAK